MWLFGKIRVLGKISIKCENFPQSRVFGQFHPELIYNESIHGFFNFLQNPYVWENSNQLVMVINALRYENSLILYISRTDMLPIWIFSIQIAINEQMSRSDYFGVGLPLWCSQTIRFDNQILNISWTDWYLTFLFWLLIDSNKTDKLGVSVCCRLDPVILLVNQIWVYIFFDLKYLLKRLGFGYW